MKKWVFKLAGLIPINLLKKFSEVDILLPYHHLVSDSYLPHISPLYNFKNKKNFIKDLDYLLKNFKPIEPCELVKFIISGAPIPKNSFLLTFDDGLKEFYEEVVPILKSKGVPAIVFINSAFVDNQSLFYRYKVSLVIDKIENGRVAKSELKWISNYLDQHLDPLLIYKDITKKLKTIDYRNKDLIDVIAPIANVSFSEFLYNQQPYLTSNQIEVLLNDGFSIGGHSIDHPYYKLISLSEQIRQTTESVNYVKKKFDVKHTFFAFPHLDYSVSENFFDILFNNKDMNIDIIFGNSNQKKDKYSNIFHRFNSENPVFDIDSLISSMLLYTIFNKVLGKTIVKRPILDFVNGKNTINSTYYKN